MEDAIDAGYAVEIDVQMSADGGLVMLHDPTLERTTAGEGPVAGQTLENLRATTIRGTDETLSSLDDVLALVSGRAPLFLDLKAPRTVERKAAMTAAVQRALGRYGGATAAMTFDPDMLGLMRRALPDTPLGILAGRVRGQTSMINRFGLDAMLHTPRTKPDFVAYFGEGLPNPAVRFHRRKRPCSPGRFAPRWKRSASHPMWTRSSSRGSSRAADRRRTHRRAGRRTRDASAPRR